MCGSCFAGCIASDWGPSCRFDAESATIECSRSVEHATLLIVDDHHDMAELTAMLLAEHGHDPTIAYNGESALALAAEFRPQVALINICLPGMDGLELAARMRATGNSVVETAVEYMKIVGAYRGVRLCR